MAMWWQLKMADATIKLAVMETEMKGMTKKLDNHIVEQREDFKSVNKTLKDLGDKLDRKYAGKWVEKVTIGVVIIIIGTLVTFGLVRAAGG